MRRILKIMVFFTGMLSAGLRAEPLSPAKIVWQPWSKEVFSQARREQKLVLLDLEAVWCHWCHVMDRETYASPEVAGWIQRHYLPVKVDQDAMPGLANRYRDYGWPATIVFDGEGKELAKRAGFIEPQEMAKLLQGLAQNPSSVSLEADSSPQYAKQGRLSDSLRADLQSRHEAAYDAELGGLRLNHKFVDADDTEYSLRLAQAGNEAEAARARKTLAAGRALLDPVWGGVYQYSHGGDWQHPHFEKILSVQRDSLLVYSLAYSLWQDPEDLKMIRGLVSYLEKFLLSPEGAFYASQDADLVPGEHSADYFALSDDERRAQGMPRIDKNIYSRENGWAIEGLIQSYRATGDGKFLAMARKAAEWVQGHRALASSPFESARWIAERGTSPSGGLSHGDKDREGPYLGDTLAMGRAYLALYGATGERTWLNLAQAAGNFIRDNFADAGGAGFLSSMPVGPLKPVAGEDENIAAARFFNLLGHYTGDPEYGAAADLAMRYLATPEIARQRLTDAGILLADEELRSPPPHVTVVGKKSDAGAERLFRSAVELPTWYLRVEWWDRGEGPMPNPDVQYPQFEKSVAFVCSRGLCSRPLFEPAELRARLEKK